MLLSFHVESCNPNQYLGLENRASVMWLSYCIFSTLFDDIIAVQNLFPLLPEQVHGSFLYKPVMCTWIEMRMGSWPNPNILDFICIALNNQLLAIFP